MPQKHSKSQSRKNQFGSYKSKGSYSVNKLAKLERHLKNHPEDEQAQQAIKNISSVPARKKPNKEVWSSQKREVAQMYAKVGINGMHALENGKLSAAIDEEHLRFDAAYKEEQMKRESKNSIPTAKKKAPRKKKKES